MRNDLTNHSVEHGPYSSISITSIKSHPKYRKEDITYFLKKRVLTLGSITFHWGIELKSNHKLIGRSGLIHIDPEHEKAELGYVISNEYWNQGIVTEATREIVSYSFITLGLNRIEARCNFDNPGSYSVMEKLGLKYEGTLRKQLKIKGEFVDQLIYAILKEDFIK